MDTLQEKTRPTWHVRFPGQPTYAQCTLPVGGPCMWQSFAWSLTDLNRSTAPEKKGSQHNLHHVGWPIHGSVSSFSTTTANEAVGKCQASIDNWLLGLPGPYQHAIGTFNTCARGPTHRSLTDSGEGYNLEGSGFPRTTPQPSQPAVFTFHLRARPVSSLTKFYQLNQSVEFKNLWSPRDLLTTQLSTVAYIYT
jgi:hypothetical protein